MIAKDQSETMVTMLDAEWTLVANRGSLLVSVSRKLSRRFVKEVKSERNQESG
jgi:hypothetical protein